MAVITGIHGISQQYAGGFKLTTVWYEALRDGLTAAGHRSVAEALSKDQVRVAFFGDLFRPGGAMTGQDPPLGAADIPPGVERDLMTGLYEAAVSQDPSLGPPVGAMGPGMAAVQVMLERLLRSRTFARVSQRGFIGNLKQVSRFLGESAIKDRVLARVHQEVDDQTQVLIGHSLGSIVAYEYLCQFQPRSVTLFVTLGSPLGIPNLIFDRLTPAPIHGHAAWPGALSRWVNVADPDDIVALRKELRGLFTASSGGTLEDRQVDNGDEPHAADRYLNAAQTGNAISDVLT